MTAMFSLILTVITILKHELSQLDIKIEEAKDIKNKLNYDLSFLKSEWEYLSSPKNIEKLSNIYLDAQNVSLMNLNDFLKILETKEGLQ